MAPVKNNIPQIAEKETLEDPTYPVEFLTCIKSTAFAALEGYLERTAAPQEVIALLEDINIFTSWQVDLERGGKVEWIANKFMEDTVASVTHHIVAVGGVFYCPDGTTNSRLTK